jgi:hypothetical protein
VSDADHWVVVREVISSTNDGAQVMSALPGLVRRLIDEDAWREFAAPGSGKLVCHETFTSFVRTRPPEGLGGRSSQLLALCGTDEDLVVRVRALLLGEVPEAANHGEIGRGRSGPEGKRLSDNLFRPGRGTRSDYLVSRLKRDNPDLAARVVAGELTPSAAARQMGWRKPTINVSTPERVANSLRQHMTPEQLAELAAILTTPESP